MSLNFAETKHILLVEDKLMYREALSFALNMEPDLSVVGQAESLAESRDQVADGTDAAVIYLGPPDGDELGLIRELREDHPDLRVLVLMTSDNQGRNARSLEATVDGVLDKDASLHEVAEAVRTL